MEYLSWFYTFGIKYYKDSWFTLIHSTSHYFSPLLLLKSLFSPWKRLIVINKKPGFNIARWFETFSFNLVSRVIGIITRFFLIIFCVFALIFMFLGGASGFIFWILMPIFGYPIYKKYKNQPEHYVQRILNRYKENPKESFSPLFKNTAGEYLCAHLGVTTDDLIANAKPITIDWKQYKIASYQDLITTLIEQNVWDKEFLRKKAVDSKDLVLVAGCWDAKQAKEYEIHSTQLGSAGLGLELLYGYTPVLSQYSINLSTSVDFAHHLIAREDIVSQIERVLTAGSNVALTGPPGVGKKTVVLEFAKRAMLGEFGPNMSFRKICEFDYNSLLSGSKDLNEKKTLLAQVLAEAAGAGNIILMIRDIHRLTNPEVEGYDFTDIFEEYLGKKDLKIITISTSQEYDRFILSNMRLRKYLEKIEVRQPSKDEAFLIAVEAAQNWEKKRGITIEIKALRRIIDESDRYISDTPFPEKALELLDALVVYIEQQRRNIVTLEDANVVLAEKTGISFAALTSDEQQKLGNIEDIIHEKLINQESAISAIARSLRARTIGGASSDRPMGTYLFLGPTGVGKTETAKVLAKVYYGSEDNILRFDMAEYAGTEGIERLIGSVTKNLPGNLTNAIKNQPASILLLDEIEKSPPQIFNLFLSLLDEGMITDAFNRKINCRHLFVIGTSNAGAENIRELVAQGIKGEELQKKTLDYILQKGVFSPEFLNRFDGVIVYEPLNQEHLKKIATLLMQELINNLKKEGLTLTYSEDTLAKLVEEGYEPAFGARPMRRLVNLVIGDVIGKSILTKEINEGDEIRIVPLDGKERYKVEKL